MLGGLMSTEPTPVTMTCMTTKQKFDVVDPAVVVLANGRYAYRAECPWPGKQGQVLFAYKFCSRAAYEAFCAVQGGAQEDEEDEHEEAEIP